MSDLGELQPPPCEEEPGSQSWQGQIGSHGEAGDFPPAWAPGIPARGSSETRGPSTGLSSKPAPSGLAQCPGPQKAPPPSFVCIPGVCVSLGSGHVYAGSLVQSWWLALCSRPPGLGPWWPRRAH